MHQDSATEMLRGTSVYTKPESSGSVTDFSKLCDYSTCFTLSFSFFFQIFLRPSSKWLLMFFQFFSRPPPKVLNNNSLVVSQDLEAIARDTKCDATIPLG